MEWLLLIGKSVIDNAPYLVGVILPPVVQYLNKDVPNERERFIVSGIVCFICGIILNWKSVVYGNPQEVFFSASLIFAESQTVFKLYFKNSWVQSYINRRIQEGKEVSEAEIVSSNP